MAKKTTTVVVDEPLPTEARVDGGANDFDGVMTDVSDGVIVELIRLEPATDHNGQKIRGFIENLPSGTTKQWIKERHGGGSFRVVKRNERRQIIGSTDLQIAGSPLPVTLSAAAIGDPALQPKLPSVPSLPSVQVSGVPIGVDWQSFWLPLLQAKIAQTMLSPQPALDTMKVIELMQKSNPSVDLSGQIRGLKEVLTLAEGLTPEPADGGGDVMSLLTSAFNALATVKRSPIAGRPVGLLPEKTTVDRSVDQTVTTDNPNPTTEGEGMPLDFNAIVGTAIQQIISGFRLTPPKESERIVRILNTLLPNLGNSVKAVLKTKRDTLFDMAELQLVEDFADDPDKRAQFADYFAKVFDGFTDLSQ
jgi:hypothetical protein